MRPDDTGSQHNTSLRSEKPVLVSTDGHSLPDVARPGVSRPGINLEEEDNQLLAGAPTLPAPVRPGAQRPDQELRGETPDQADVITDATTESFRVPRVLDRPLDIDEGDKIAVTRFELAGFTERPEFGLDMAEIQALLEEKREAWPEGFTVGRMQEVADEITVYYRNKGMILAQAFVPVQDVTNGVVRIEVLEGLLGRVVAEGNDKYSEEVLSVPFKDLKGQPVTKDEIEQALLTLTEYPGLSMFGIFQPGQKVGEADMVVKVQDEKPWEGALRWDNHGLEETGERRIRADFSWNNLSGDGDRIAFVSQKNAKPWNTYFQSLEYDRPMFDSSYHLNIGWNRNTFDVLGDLADQNIASETESVYFVVRKDFVKSRVANLSTSLEFARKQALTDIQGVLRQQDELAVLTLSLNYDSVDPEFAGLNELQVQYSHGFNDVFGAMGGQGTAANAAVPTSRTGGSGARAEGMFDKLFISYTRNQSLSILGQWLGTEFFDNKSLLFRTELFYTADLLVPLEQYSIGGPNHVRAYLPSEGLFDKGYYAGFEYVVPAPLIANEPAFGNYTWGELVAVSAFIDTSAGTLNDPLPQDTVTQNFNGGGISISFNYPNVFNGKLTVAAPFGKPATAGRDPTYWLDFNYIF